MCTDPTEVGKRTRAEAGVLCATSKEIELRRPEHRSHQAVLEPTSEYHIVCTLPQRDAPGAQERSKWGPDEAQFRGHFGDDRSSPNWGAAGP